MPLRAETRRGAKSAARFAQRHANASAKVARAAFVKSAVTFLLMLMPRHEQTDVA